MPTNIDRQCKTVTFQKLSSLDDRPKHSDWRDEFNREVFKTTFRDQPLGCVSFRHPEVKKTLPRDLQSLINNSSTCYTIKDANDIIQCILSKEKDDLPSSCSYAYRASLNFKLHTSQVPTTTKKSSPESQDESTTVPLLQIYKEKSGVEKFICPAEKMFDEIYWAHAKVGHKKTFSTFKAINKKFANIPREVVQKFIEMCPICASTKRSDIGRNKSNQSDMNILEELRKQCVNNNKNAMVIARRRKKYMKNQNGEYDDSSNVFVSNTQNQAESKTIDRKRKVSNEGADPEEDDPRRAPMEEKNEWYNNKNMSKRIQVGHSKRLKEVTVPKSYTLVSEYKLEQLKDENSRMELELSLWAHEYDDIDADIARGLKEEVERLKNLLKKEECRRKESDSKYKEVTRRFKEVENEFKDYKNKHDIADKMS